MGWEQDQYERSFSDYTQDKRYGETYHEASMRQSDARAAQNEAMEKAQKEEWARNSRNTLSAEDFYDGKTERKPLAKIAGNIGICLLIIAAICHFAGISYTPFEGTTLAGLALKWGIGFVALGYFAHVIAIIVFIIACIYLITFAFTPDGFQLSAIPGSSWAFSIIVVVVATIISQVFGRR